VLGEAAHPIADLVISHDRVVGRLLQAAAEIREDGEERSPRTDWFAFCPSVAKALWSSPWARSVIRRSVLPVVDV
jgi:hypothetical protein